MTEVLVEDRSARIRIVPPPTRHFPRAAVFAQDVKRNAPWADIRPLGHHVLRGLPDMPSAN